MKKIFLILSFVIVAGLYTASADPGVDPRVRQSFQREFPTARILKWEKNGDYLKATFVFNENRTEAWFSNEGELQGTIRCLLYDQLPFAVMRELKAGFHQPVLLISLKSRTVTEPHIE